METKWKRAAKKRVKLLKVLLLSLLLFYNQYFKYFFKIFATLSLHTKKQKKNSRVIRGSLYFTLNYKTMVNTVRKTDYKSIV